MTERIFNFSAGPAVLPEAVLIQAQQELLNLNGLGMSILEISHRSKAFDQILENCISNLRQLMNIPSNYHVLFLQGGASMQFSMVPINFLRGKSKAGYLLSGTWAKKAMQEAQREGDCEVLWSGKDQGYVRMPADSEWTAAEDLAYVHFTSNETIQGIAFQNDPVNKGVPLICDASSDILSRPLDISQYAMIYAGAQKNIGPAGVTLVILRDDLLQTRAKDLHTMMDYGTYVESNSLYNTPPVFAIYMIELVTRQLLKQGGLEAAYMRNQAKAKVLYQAIDNSQGFYKGHANVDSRSLMNVTFRLPNEELEASFVKQAQARGLDGLKGHRSVGGIRASIYNAFPIEGVQSLVDLMQEFQQKHG